MLKRKAKSKSFKKTHRFCEVHVSIFVHWSNSSCPPFIARLAKQILKKVTLFCLSETCLVVMYCSHPFIFSYVYHVINMFIPSLYYTRTHMYLYCFSIGLVGMAVSSPQISLEWVPISAIVLMTMWLSKFVFKWHSCIFRIRPSLSIEINEHNWPIHFGDVLSVNCWWESSIGLYTRWCAVTPTFWASFFSKACYC